ncbi:claudin-15-like isoform X2 [Engraulis encrasicolus]|uniref:claudin-15-like isoform X2 n=2 Tax=Engraulis encrasicolus TaxID=184585 RepID=UPI002FD70582
MKEICEAVVLLIGFLSTIMAFASLYHPYWRESTNYGSAITTATLYENLWMSCATDSNTNNCYDFQSLLALPGYIQASRALMIAAIVMGFFGIIATLVGMQCSKVGGENYVLKGRVAGIGGVFFLLEGLCTMISVSWYAFNITQEFFDPLYPGTKYEIGEGLYIGWCSATLALCGGACLLCSCKFESTEEKMPYHYQPPTQVTAYSGPVMSQGPPSHYNRNAYV